MDDSYDGYYTMVVVQEASFDGGVTVKALSQARADAVMKAVVAGGIAANRLTAKGFDMEAPVADNRSEDGRAKNRRVELVKK